MSKVGKDVLSYSFPKRSLRLSREEIVKKLLKKKITNIQYTKDRITLKFDGKILSNEIVIKEHEPWTGSWDRYQPIVYIDNDIPEKFRETESIHETLEKYGAEEYGLDPDVEGHEFAETAEFMLYTEMHPDTAEKDWIEYGKIVERVHRKEMAHLHGKVYDHYKTG